MSVLIVEDDEGVRQSLATLLEEEGYEVQTAHDGAAALQRLHAGSQPSLILLDLMMPGMDGIEFRNQQLADKRLREIPVIILSARPDGEKTAADLGATDFLPKPMSFESLLHAVQNRAITVVTSVDLPGKPKTIHEALKALNETWADDSVDANDLDFSPSSSTR